MPYHVIAAAYVRSRFAYRVSFFARAAAFAAADLTPLLLTGIVVARFRTIAGWSWPELAVLYGLSQIAGGLARCFSIPLDHFDELIVSGDLDGVLTRPLSPLGAVLAGGVEPMSVVRVAVGVATLGLAFHAAAVPASAGNLLCAAAAALGGALILFSLTLMVAALSFWQTSTGKLQDIVQGSSRAFAEYPLSIYPSAVRAALTWVIPVGLAIYYPARRLLGHAAAGGPLAFAALPFGLLFLLAGLLLWRAGLRRYQSTGS